MDSERELNRNGWQPSAHPRRPGRPPLTGGYRLQAAQARARTLASKPRVKRKLVVREPRVAPRHGWAWPWVVPRAGGGTLSRMQEPLRISHETIYSAIYVMPRGELRTEVIGLLRKSHKTRRPRARAEDRRGLIPNMTSIDERPIEAAERLVPGHWTLDPRQRMRWRGRVTSSRVRPTDLRWALWSSGRACSPCLHKWTTPQPRVPRAVERSRYAAGDERTGCMRRPESSGIE